MERGQEERGRKEEEEGDDERQEGRTHRVQVSSVIGVGP